MNWIQTWDGIAFDLDNPLREMVNINTIALCLARKCRFGGHCEEFYSVAQHSVHVCDLVKQPELKLAALLHDAHEVYSGFGDVLNPAKYLDETVSAFLKQHTEKIDNAIADRFGISPEKFHSPIIKRADLVMLATEARDLMKEPPLPWLPLPEPRKEHIVPWDIGDSVYEFLSRYYALMRSL